MITIISGTNRIGSATLPIARQYTRLLTELHSDTQLLSLEDLPHDFAFKNQVYGHHHQDYDAIIDQYIVAAEKLVFISPEYNGGFPGVLKAFIDSFYPKHIHHKKAALVGVASGRAGNLRGMDQLTNVLHYLQVHVLPLKVPISKVNTLVNSHGEISDADTLKVLQTQMQRLVAF